MTPGAFATGFLLGGALIVAIGAQNAFVLRQGLRREHVGWVVLVCAGADALLTAVGVAGVGRLLRAVPGLALGLTLFGAVFLAAYGAFALRRALAGHAGLQAAAGAPPASRRSVLAQALAFTLLNPHVYLDTVLLLGAAGAQQAAGAARVAFVGGVSAASALWFGSLGFGARLLAPWFARPAAWRVLDGLVALTMFALAAGLGLRARALLA